MTWCTQWMQQRAEHIIPQEHRHTLSRTKAFALSRLPWQPCSKRASPPPPPGPKGLHSPCGRRGKKCGVGGSKGPTDSGK